MDTWPLALLGLYFLPTLIALINRHDGWRGLFVANLALGFLAWPALLIAALMPPAE